MNSQRLIVLNQKKLKRPKYKKFIDLKPLIKQKILLVMIVVVHNNRILLKL